MRRCEKAALELVCNAPKDCVDCKQSDPAHSHVRMAQYIERKLSNSTVRERFKNLASADLPVKVRMLSEHAKAAGLSACPRRSS